MVGRLAVLRFSADGLILWVASAAVWALGAAPAPAHAIVLLTADEAAQLRLAPDEVPSQRHVRGIPPGPQIVILVPTVRETGNVHLLQTNTPMNLVVSFQPNAAPVDISSLQVTARKGLFSKSLTGLLKPYVHGDALQATDLSIPEGRFLIEISIADRAGAQTVESYRLEVRAQ